MIGRRIVTSGLVLLSLTFWAAAQTKVVPIVSLTTVETGGRSSINSGNLLGGVENGRWLDAKTTFGKVESSQKYSLFDFEKGMQGEFLLGEIETGSIGCPETYSVYPRLAAAADLALGANAGWPILPRRAKAVSLPNAAYKKVVADFLKLHGLRKSPAKLEQAFRVDLDGDGVDEVVLAAGHYIGDSNEAKIGSYTFLLVRKITGKKARTLFVGGTILKTEHDYYEADYEVSGFADLNGDGQMEIIVHLGGYEESGTKVFEMKAGKWLEIKALAYFCGLGSG